MAILNFIVRSDAQRALARAAAAATRPDRVALVADGSPTHINLVFAEDLAEALHGDRARRERTFVVNAERAEVLELLEAHGLGGAVECAEPGDWAEPGYVFVRKDAVRDVDGEAMGGPTRESARYVRWTRPACASLIELVCEVGYDTLVYSRRDDELVLSAVAAREHGLPAIELRIRTGGASMVAQPFPRAGCYASFVGPPGGVLALHLEDDPSGRSLEELAGHAAPIEQVVLAGGQRMGLAWHTGEPGTVGHVARCCIHVPHRRGRLLLRAARSHPSSPRPSCADVLREPSLQSLVESLRVEGAT